MAEAEAGLLLPCVRTTVTTVTALVMVLKMLAAAATAAAATLVKTVAMTRAVRWLDSAATALDSCDT